MSDEDLICICMGVTRGDIKAAIKKGCHDIASLSRETACCTGCGTCEDRVKKILEEETKN